VTGRNTFREQRQRVLIRDDWLCQLQHHGCRELATHVHDRTAGAAGHTPRDADLESACAPCAHAEDLLRVGREALERDLAALAAELGPDADTDVDTLMASLGINMLSDDFGWDDEPGAA